MRAAAARRGARRAPLRALLACALVARAGAHVRWATKTNLTVLHVNALDPLAVCNDGSPGAYYFAAAPSPMMANVWLLYLEGKDWCWDYTSCTSRWQYDTRAMSSKSWPASRAEGGIFSPQAHKNPFAGANKALLGYCSSDAWVGDTAASTASFGYAFRGQRLFRATLLAIVQQHGMGRSLKHSGVPDQLLLAGGGVGGRGAMFLLDSVAGALAAAGVAEGAVVVRGLFDAPLLLPVQPLSPRVLSLQVQTQRALGLLNASALFGEACLDAYPAPTAQWVCLYPSYRLPFIQTPYLLAAPQFDKWQLSYDLDGIPPPYDPAQSAYASAFQAQMVKTSAVAVPSPGGGANALFSAACYKSGTARSPAFWGVRVAEGAAGAAVPAAAGAGAGAAAVPFAGVPLRSLRDVLQAWFFDGASGLTVADDCTGFACGPACRPNAGHPRKAPTPAQADAAAARAATAAATSSAKHRREDSAARALGAVGLIAAVTSAFGYMALRLLPRPERLTPAQRRALEEGTPLRARMERPTAADSVLSGNPSLGAARFSGF